VLAGTLLRTADSVPLVAGEEDPHTCLGIRGRVGRRRGMLAAAEQCLVDRPADDESREVLGGEPRIVELQQPPVGKAREAVRNRGEGASGRLLVERPAELG